jgi:hypothetical protein
MEIGLVPNNPGRDAAAKCLDQAQQEPAEVVVGIVDGVIQPSRYARRTIVPIPGSPARCPLDDRDDWPTALQKRALAGSI